MSVPTVDKPEDTSLEISRLPVHDGESLEKDEEKAVEKEAQLTDQSNILPRSEVVKIFLGLDLLILLAFFDQTVVATLLPTLASDLDGGNATVWVATAYLLTSCIATIVYGRLSDIWGRKQALLTAIVIFLIFNIACSASQTINELIVFRALLGLGGGALISLSMIIVSDVVSLRERGKFQAIIEAVIVLGNAVGPLLGGVFAETNWRITFWMQIPLSLLALVMIGWALPFKQVEGDWRKKVKQVDYGGILLVTAACVLVLIGLNFGGIEYAWTSGVVLSLLIVGSCLYFALAAWEWIGASRSDRFIAIIPHHIFNRTVTAVLLLTFTNGAAFLSVAFFVPQFLQIVMQETPIVSGALILPWLVLVTFAVTICGFAVSRFGVYRPYIVCGLVAFSVSCGLLSTLDASSSLVKVALFEVLGGLGMGCAIQTSLIAAQASVPRSEMAVVTSSRNFLRQIGGAISLAISGTVINNQISNVPGLSSSTIAAILSSPTSLRQVPQLAADEDLLQQVLQAYTTGFQRVFQINAGYVVCGFFASLFIQHHTLRRADDAKRKEEGKAWLQARQEARKRKRQGDVLEQPA